MVSGEAFMNAEGEDLITVLNGRAEGLASNAVGPVTEIAIVDLLGPGRRLPLRRKVQGGSKLVILKGRYCVGWGRLKLHFCL